MIIKSRRENIQKQETAERLMIGRGGGGSKMDGVDRDGDEGRYKVQARNWPIDATDQCLDPDCEREPHTSYSMVGPQTNNNYIQYALWCILS